MFAEEYTNQTALHPLGLAALLICGALLLILPRRFAPMPLIVMACFVSPGQRLVVGGLDFDLLRLLVLCGWTRLIVRGELRTITWKPLDTLILVWASVTALVYTLLWASVSALVNRLGFMFDAIGMYFMFRAFVREWRDFDRLILIFSIVAIPVSVAFLVERSTGHNAFAFLGGVPQITAIRDGRLRCQGAFPHPIIAGCFFGTLAPLCAARWWTGGGARRTAIAGVGAIVVIVFCTASSTPVMSLVLGVVGGLLFYVRKHMRAIRWGAVGVLFCLQLVMNHPVYHLLARVNVVGGSTGWHRYHLIDKAIENFGEWAVLGVKSTAHWGLGLGDVTNQYVLEGVRGGFAALVLFVVIVVVTFRGIGRSLQFYGREPWQLAYVWALGVTMFVHCMNFIAISYFGQMNLAWYLTLGVVGSMMPTKARATAAARTSTASAARPAPAIPARRAANPAPSPRRRPGPRTEP